MVKYAAYHAQTILFSIYNKPKQGFFQGHFDTMADPGKKEMKCSLDLLIS